MTARQILAEVTARANAATKAPWTWDGQRVPTLNGRGGDTSYAYDLEVIEARHDGGCACRRSCELELTVSSADRAFISSARQDVPALAAALTAVLDRAEPGGWIEALITAHLDPTAVGPADATGPPAVAASGAA